MSRCRQTHISKATAIFVWWYTFIPILCGREIDQFPAPVRLQRPLNTTFRQINNGSPADPYPASKNSLQLDIITDEEPDADAILEDIQAGLRYVLQTNNEWTFAIHGTGTTAVSAVMDNMIERGDNVLVLVGGYWGELMANMSMRLGANTYQFKKQPGDRFHLNEIESHIIAFQPKILALVHGESSTGVFQPLDGIGDICRKYGVYLVVDSISVVGIRPLQIDHFKVDCSITSSQKGLGSLAGLGVVSLSPRAVERIRKRSYPPVAYQTDLSLQREMWKTPVSYRPQSFSMFLMYALREGLATIAREGKDNVYKRHLETSRRLEEVLRSFGLRNFVPIPSDRMTSVSTFYPPKGKSIPKIVDFIATRYKIFISDGAGPTKGKVLRFLTYGSNANMERINKLLNAVQHALNSPETNID